MKTSANLGPKVAAKWKFLGLALIFGDRPIPGGGENLGEIKLFSTRRVVFLASGGMFRSKVSKSTLNVVHRFLAQR